MVLRSVNEYQLYVSKQFAGSLQIKYKLGEHVFAVEDIM